MYIETLLYPLCTETSKKTGFWKPLCESLLSTNQWDHGNDLVSGAEAVSQFSSLESINVFFLTSGKVPGLTSRQFFLWLFESGLHVFFLDLPSRQWTQTDFRLLFHATEKYENYFSLAWNKIRKAVCFRGQDQSVKKTTRSTKAVAKRMNLLSLNFPLPKMVP